MIAFYIIASAPNYHEEKVEWMNRIENSHIDRGLMNKIIMNYLVNGIDLSSFYITLRNHFVF